ncbi:hypothetical protein U9M48_006800 [Paspalum notatum var. saurae]|uniref:RING-type E3 ubiquitin transferase n=1 Tax=Paspalum notatum var. saurae TaxID=547442 RepID=A0AAQ3SLZ5_PASNO
MAASLDGAVLGLGTAAVAVASWVKYLAVSGQLRLEASAATASIADLRSILPGDKGESRLVACLFTEWRGIFGWTFDLHALLFRSWKEQIVTSFRSVPFVLASSELGYPPVVHINVDKADQPLPLTTVFHKLIPIETTPYTLFQTIIGNGYPIALLDEEKILLVGKVIDVSGKEFKFTWASERGELCDIYEERQSGEDGNGLLVECGSAWRKVNVQRILDESAKNLVKMRSEEAEHRSMVLDPANPSVKSQAKAMAAAAVEGSMRRMNWNQKSEFYKKNKEVN